MVGTAYEISTRGAVYKNTFSSKTISFFMKTQRLCIASSAHRFRFVYILFSLETVFKSYRFHNYSRFRVDAGVDAR